MKPCDCVERRIESMAEASAIDARIRQQWDGHPHCVVVEAPEDVHTEQDDRSRV